MNIALISPKMGLRPMDSEYKRRMAPPLALATVAALTPMGHRVTIHDENARPLRLPESVELVGITVNVQTAPRAYAIATRLRSQGIPVVLGGIHASANPEETLRYADAVCVGDAEGVWPKIIEDASRDRLEGIYRNRDTGGLLSTCIPRWDLVDRSRYLVSNIICATRGCPHCCEFCYNSSEYVKKRRRLRAISSVLDEIRSLNSRQVLFVDDNLIGDLDWAQTIIEELKGLDVVWHGAVSANIVEHPELLDAMQASGCRSLFIGFESINPQALRAVCKNQNHVERYDRLVHELHVRGIMVHASLVFGFDEDGPEVFEETLAWLMRNKIETMTAHILTPYPGTQLHARWRTEGRITDFDWGHYDTSHVVFSPKGMTSGQLRMGYLWMYERFYSLTSIVRRLPDFQRNRLPYLLFNLGYRKFGKITSAFARVNGGMRGITRYARRVCYGIE